MILLVKYFELVPYAFKKFGVLRALRTGLPTALHYLHPNPLPPSEKPALFTMNIMPPMMTVWHHLVRKNLGDRVDTVIFDCSGTLDPADFPGARVQKFLNLYAATKSDEFLYKIAKTRKIGWICDDDMFIVNPKCVDRIIQEFKDPQTAVLSFRPRTWWRFEIDGTSYEPCGSYCLAIKREIYCDKEHLSLSPCDGNTHVKETTRTVRYDTFDKANETLIRKGYRCAIIPESEREEYVTGFSGVSSAVMLLWHFGTPEQMMAYLEAPADNTWGGNTLYTILSGLLAISAMQEMHQKITGKPYVLRSMPSLPELERLRRAKAPLLREGHDFERTLQVAERLRRHL